MIESATLSERRANQMTAAAGLGLACVAAIILIGLGVARGDAWRITSAIVFASSLVAMHLASTLYHSAIEPDRAGRMKVLDHCAIYLLIAGTYTPFTLIGLRDDIGWGLLIAIWSLAACGIAFKLFFTGRLRVLSTLIYVAMGWLVLLAIKPVMAALDDWTFGWMLAGGIVYTVGTLFYHRPNLRYSHAIWHGFVIGGGACHFVAVLAQVLSPR